MRRLVGRIAVALLALALAMPFAAVAARGGNLPKADSIIVFKKRRELQLLRGGFVLKRYPIALGGHPRGPKIRAGDRRTPEGRYVVDGRNGRSAYWLSLHISYPNRADVARAEAAGRPPGGEIFIHGMPPAFGRHDPRRFYKDWTDGCIAVGNIAIEEIWAAVDDGTPIEIRP